MFTLAVLYGMVAIPLPPQVVRMPPLVVGRTAPSAEERARVVRVALHDRRIWLLAEAFVAHARGATPGSADRGGGRNLPDQAAAAAALLLVGGVTGGAVVAVVAFGLGFGVASLATPQLLAGRCGTTAYGTIAGVLTTPVTLAKATAPLAAAALLTTTGSYVPVLLGIAGACLVAAVGVRARTTLRR